MSETDMKKRKPYWTKEEVLLLMELVKANVHVLEGKFGPGVTSARRQVCQEAWQVITATLNSSGSHKRTKEEVEKKWKNVKSQAKHKYSEFGKLTKGTGGGPAPAPISPVTNAVIDILGQDNVTQTGVPGSIDTTMLQVLDLMPPTDREIYDKVLPVSECSYWWSSHCLSSILSIKPAKSIMPISGWNWDISVLAYVV